MRRELARKLIHLATLVAPLLVWILPRGEGLALLGSALGLALAIELARRRSRWLRYRFLTGTRPLLRPHERHGLAGATWLALSYFLALLLLPLPVAVLAMLYAGAGDAVAALVGKRWGRHRTAWGKSWEGAAGGFVVNLLLGLALPGIPLLPAFVGAAAASTLEFLPGPVDDNLWVVLGGGLVLLLAVGW